MYVIMSVCITKKRRAKKGYMESFFDMKFTPDLTLLQSFQEDLDDCSISTYSVSEAGSEYDCTIMKGSVAQFVMCSGYLLAETGHRVFRKSKYDQLYLDCPDNFRFTGDHVRTAATLDDLNHLFMYMYVREGDFDALANEAPNYTLDSIWTAGENVPDYDPMHAMKHYLECTTQNMKKVDPGMGEVMLASDGTPFYEHIYSVKKTNKKVRPEPEPLSPENQEIMKEVGLDPRWVLPPNDARAMLASLRFQAGRQIPNAGIADYGPVIDSINDMSRFRLTDDVAGPRIHDWSWMVNICSGFEDKSSGWRHFSKLYNTLKSNKQL